MEARLEVKAVYEEINNAFTHLMLVIKDEINTVEEIIQEEKTNPKPFKVFLSQYIDYKESISNTKNIMTEQFVKLNQENTDQLLQEVDKLLTELMIRCSNDYFSILYPKDSPEEDDQDNPIDYAVILLLEILQKKQALLICLPIVNKADQEIDNIMQSLKKSLAPRLEFEMNLFIKNLPSPIDEAVMYSEIDQVCTALGKIKKIYTEIADLRIIEESKLDKILDRQKNRIEYLQATLIPKLYRWTQHWLQSLLKMDAQSIQHSKFVKECLNQLEDSDVDPDKIKMIQDNLNIIVQKQAEYSKQLISASFASYFSWIPNLFWNTPIQEEKSLPKEESTKPIYSKNTLDAS